MELLWKIVESGLSKLIDKGMDYALSKQERTTFESLRSNMRSLCTKAIDVKDDIQKAELSGKKKRKREINEWLEQVQTIENELCMLKHEIRTEGLVRKFFSGDQLTTLEAKLRGLVEQSRHFGELVCDVCDIKGDILLTKEMVGEEFDKNLETILGFLLEDNVSSIGIYGMGGIGKTTLAKHVNNRLQQQTHERVAWITISQEFTITKLQDEIAKFVHLDLSHERNEDKRASGLNRVLSKSKNLVFIFDDVWEDIDLKMLGDPLSLDGCKLLITTRSKKVCNQMGCERLIKLKTLKENEAWNLFEETHGQMMNLNTEVQEIAKSMVEVCDGLPLGVITIAGSMKGETNFHVWSHALRELKESTMGQEDMEEKVFKVLKYSFDRLDRRDEKKSGYSKFQLCFLYCSLYPEDYEIKRVELIRKFILEELLDKRTESRKELISQGHAILEKLVNVCLLERIGEDGVKMHDLVRAMALKINEGKFKVIVGLHHILMRFPTGEEWWTKDIEKMSLINNGIGQIREGVSPNCPKLSALHLKGYVLEFIPNSFFLQMPNLCILDLSKISVKKLPNSLSHLVSLKALLLTRCYFLEHVPYLGNMKELRELDLSVTGIKEIPRGTEELSNLKFISLFGARCLQMLPEHLLLKFPHLQCLYLSHGKPAPIGEIQELEHLEEFGGRVTCASEFNQLIRSRPRLEYHIVLGGHNRFGNLPAQNTNELVLFNYDFNLKKNKDVVLLAENIKHLTLRMCKGLSKCLVEDLPRLNNPMSIQRLSITDCGEIECLLRTEQLSERDALTSSSVSISPPPTCCFFSSLISLGIYSCKNMKKLGLPASQLQNLENLTVMNCNMIEEIFEASKNIGGAESREMHVVSLPKLEKLYLDNLPRLKSIYNVTLVCSSIQYITLKECQGLEKLPLVFDRSNYETLPSSLKEICLARDEGKWWEKLEFGHTSHHSLLQRFIRF